MAGCGARRVGRGERAVHGHRTVNVGTNVGTIVLPPIKSTVFSKLTVDKAVAMRSPVVQLRALLARPPPAVLRLRHRSDSGWIEIDKGD